MSKKEGNFESEEVTGVVREALRLSIHHEETC
jgi:hypothetical protein